MTGFIETILTLPPLKMDLEPNATITKWTTREFEEWAHHHFQLWGANISRTILNLYSDAAQLGGGFAYYNMDANFGITCGTLHLARSAAQGFRNPVYMVEPIGWPDAPILSSQYPFHLFDYEAGFGVYLTDPLYHPGERDMAFGASLRKAWMAVGPLVLFAYLQYS